MTPFQTFNSVLTDAINYVAEHGFVSEEEWHRWQQKFSDAVGGVIKGMSFRDEMTRRSLSAIFERLVTRDGALKHHPGVERFTVNRIAPYLRSELDRRVLASANLIKLNREQAILKTLSRFSGWMTSAPAGGPAEVDRRKLKDEISKPLRQLPFVERRVLIDQGHKLNSSISATIATGSGAIAGIWRSNFRQAGYDYREDHRERDGHVYLIPSSWAAKAGLVKVGSAGWSTDITQPAEEPFCRCHFVYLYHLRQLPEDMLTAKGKDAKTRP